MLRNLQHHLLAWHQASSRKPLILRGARQVGKSTLVRLFAESAQIRLHEINLEKHKQLAASIVALDVDSFLKEAQLIAKKGSIESEGSILFIDEIQEIPEALALLRYLYEQKPKLPVIAAGSLLEFALADEARAFSMPVGRVEYAYLGPCSFGEFLLALGEGSLLEYLQGCSLDDPFSATAHKQLTELYHLYLFVGGMPEVIQVYVDTKDLQKVLATQASIVSTYRDDFAKYGKRSALTKLQKIFDYVPIGLGRKIKYSNIDRDARAADLKLALQLLQMANVITAAYGTDAVRPPLTSAKNAEIYKVYFIDCGLLNSLSGNTLVPQTGQALTDHQGKIAEQFIAQHLAFLAPPYQRPELYYWLREGKSNNAEVDFLWVTDGKIVPIEVKSGSAGSLRSLHQFIDRAGGRIAVRFDLNPPQRTRVQTKLTSDPTREVDADLLSLPIYAVEHVRHFLGQM